MPKVTPAYLRDTRRLPQKADTWLSPVIAINLDRRKVIMGLDWSSVWCVGGTITTKPIRGYPGALPTSEHICDLRTMLKHFHCPCTEKCRAVSKHGM